MYIEHYVGCGIVRFNDMRFMGNEMYKLFTHLLPNSNIADITKISNINDARQVLMKFYTLNKDFNDTEIVISDPKRGLNSDNSFSYSVDIILLYNENTKFDIDKFIKKMNMYSTLKGDA